MEGEKAKPVETVETPAIPVTDIPHAGWTEDGRQVTISTRTLRGDLITFIMPANVGEKVIRAAQYALDGVSKVRGPGGPAAVGEKPYDAETVNFLASPDGGHAILVFEGVGGPSRYIRLAASGIRGLQVQLGKLERAKRQGSQRCDAPGRQAKLPCRCRRQHQTGQRITGQPVSPIALERLEQSAEAHSRLTQSAALVSGTTSP